MTKSKLKSKVTKRTAKSPEQDVADFKGASSKQDTVLALLRQPRGRRLPPLSKRLVGSLTRFAAFSPAS